MRGLEAAEVVEGETIRKMLMDEPFGPLDPGTRQDVQLFLLELWEEFMMTIFFVTHDLEEAVFLGSRLLVLSQFYSDDRGDLASTNRGSKIVCDHATKSDGQIYSTMEKSTSQFAELIAQVRAEGFDPEYTQHVSEFNLEHRHSFQTLTLDEHAYGIDADAEKA